ncbi:hypothetical protein [Candidatus Nanobsidianus stetteri]|uniref:Uncharacterized protein n=1 Tax=Nanobsidianus stetteri TaxID=1294122 RepID=A0A2T9WL98_NANST|nr:hypothetical protein [Candidatus Nanobsidianus stetteri]MCC5447233.1 hypothetical protein [Candidatus Nanobsidianus stetteri]
MKYMDTDIVKKRARIIIPVLVFMVFLSFISAIPFIALGNTVLSVISILIGIFLIYEIKRIKSIIPPEPADILSVGKYGILSTIYWYNKSGVWKNNKMIFTWSDISDVFIIRTWTETGRSTRTILSTTGEFLTYTFGLVRFIMKNGEYIDIDRVVDPETVVSFIKKMYLKSNF